MATKSVNAKSKRFDVRVPHHLAEEVELLKTEGESTGQFVVTAIEGEIKRRQRKQAKGEGEGEGKGKE
ncbi:YlcI/YnfO family protein [Klebsiella pneumoniae]